MAGYYRHLIPRFPHFASILTHLTRRDVSWEWTTEHNKAFGALKHSLSCDVVLRYPDISKPYQLHTDASNFAIGAVLSQLEDRG